MNEEKVVQFASANNSNQQGQTLPQQISRDQARKDVLAELDFRIARALLEQRGIRFN